MNGLVTAVIVMVVLLLPATIVAGGLEARLPNPAPYGRPEACIFSLGLVLGSNSVSLSDYGIYNGSFLSESQKRDLVGSVPDGGLSLFSSAEASGGGVVLGDVEIRVGLRAGENANLPREVLELVLFGNEVGRTYRLDGTSGEALVTAEIGAFYSQHVPALGPGAVIGGLRVLKGLAYGGVNQARGSLYSGAGGIDGNGRIELRTAKGGTGYALDLGFQYRTHSDITICTYIENALSMLRWNKGCRREVNTFLFDNVVLGSDDPDSLIKSANESHDIGSFTTRCVPNLYLVIAHPWSGTDYELAYKQGLGNGALASSKPELVMRAARNFKSWMELEASLGWSGRTGITEGMQARLGKRTKLVIGIRVSPAPWPSSLKGLSLDFGVTRLL